MNRSLLFASLALGVTACSLTVAKPDACESNVDCRAGFGFGSTCNAEGFCEAAAPPDRCQRTFPTDLFAKPERYRDAEVLGALFDDVAHEDSVLATELAVLEVNEAGGLQDNDFAVVFCDYGDRFDDDLDDVEASEEGALWLADVLGTSAIVGARGSSRTKAAFLALEDRDVLMISPSATSPELTDIDEPSPSDENPGRLWRTVPPDGLQAEVIVADLADRGVGSLAIIAQQGSYGDALSALVVTGYDETVGGDVEVYPYTNSLFGAVADVAASGAEEVVFISSDIADYVTFLDAAVANSNLESTYDAMGIFLTDAAFNVQLLENTGTDGQVLFDNIRGTRPAPASGSLFNTFSGAFKTQFGQDPQSSGFTVHTYDATWLVMYAYAWVRLSDDTLGGRALGRGLRMISEGTEVKIRATGWDAALEAFDAGETIDVEGGSGQLDYDPATEETSAPIQIWGIGGTGPDDYEFTDMGMG